MPGILPVPATGFQALILCGPGISLSTFSSNPEECPKCLLPVANRPQVYYAIDWLRRSGVSDITLVTPPSALAPLQAALKQNPYLTSLPTPSPSIVTSQSLEMTMGTAEVLRLPEVQACIKADFIVLPCDLVCEIPGESLLEAWMVSQGALGGSSTSHNAQGPTSGLGGEQGGRRGGLSVYYQTQGREESVKGEATDFVAIAPLEKDEAPVVSHPLNGPATLRFGLSKLVLSAPMDTIKEKMEQDKGFLVRHSLVEKHAQVKFLTQYRDAHIYVFPYWVKDLARNQEKFQSISEDLIGFWAKSEWQEGLGEKLGINKILQESHAADENRSLDGESLEDEIDLKGMSTTKAGSNMSSIGPLHADDSESPVYASRVKVPESGPTNKPSQVPPMLAYVQRGSAPFVRRVDSSAMLLSTSLRLAKLESVEEAGSAASPLAHNHKVAHPEGVAQRCTVTKTDCLLDRNVTVEEKCVIKESVIGSNCHISSGARLTRCLVMDGAVIGERCQLTGCIVGKRSNIGRESIMKDCEIQHGNVIPEETDAKNEKFMVFEGLDEDEDGMDVSGDFEENQGDLGF
ncbi:eukaryotic translation initiation factor subunit eIF2B-gamma [Penicillium hispanicum]|uniref:eukaryotic translation initiation factor subunit eIF2B-gamma n=1 Tax=Penicillium hispanicum TaxID=1080232 RepID=UPI00253F6A1D|nr:eukaryotic translation initiation factor subunit eIF2B-gamma [Penicillium hispanicum]KAJ5578751.1 eukaryotic translation initiation factor subunit eIF2B-gamma [Penicillium hispanicum]